LLSLPITRLRLYTSKYLAGALITVAYCAVSILAAIPFGWMFGIDFNAGLFWDITLPGIAFAMAIYSIAMLVSTLVNERGQLYAILGGGLLLMYVVNVIAQMVDSWEWLKYSSLFNYYKPLDIIAGSPVDVWSIVILFLLAGLTAIAGALRFNRRDVIV
jgi:ABC-2 type transport system permease protein